MTQSNSKSNGISNGTNGLHNENDTQYTVTEVPLGTPRHIRVVTVGAGASGLNLARHIELHMENVEHIIYEKNEEVGGTWFENK
jgi:NADPH-dependent glutamate synthase beta subunit-like oxidoreductase